MEPALREDFKDFILSIGRYFRLKTIKTFRIFEAIKSWMASKLYWQRGRLVRPFIHSGMVLLVIGGITLGPTLIAESFPGLTKNAWQDILPPTAVSATSLSAQMETSTLESIKPRAETFEYTVQGGDTVSTIADKFGVSVDTIRWENNLKTVKDIKPGQVLRILPASGVMHKVKPGETIYSIAKKYQVDAQAVVDWPYNSFANDETFALAVGQTLMVPEGIMPQQAPTTPRPSYYAQVPAAGTIVGTGQFAWPVGGHITQGYFWYHKAMDIAGGGTQVLAADSGQVVLVGWPSPWDYGNRIIIDHGNGMTTLYAHLSQILVSAGQRVDRGQQIGVMGATGRATGLHLHFEIKQNNVAQNPFNYLK